MDPHSEQGPSGVKKRRVHVVKNPNKLNLDEMAAYCEDSEDSFDDFSDDDQYFPDETEDDNSDLEMAENENQNEAAQTNTTPITDVSIVWSNPPLKNRQHLLFTESTGLKQQPNGNAPTDYFNLLVNDDFYKLIIDQTNIYAEEILLSSEHVRCRIMEWKPLTKEELFIFVGLVLHMGTIKINRIKDYWKTHHLFNLTCFSDHMGRNRFQMILRCLHFAKNPNPCEGVPDDKIYKIRPIINYFNERMLEVYYPQRELSLDESMISWRGRLNFRQYLPGKRHKYGIKCYVLTEPEGLTLKLMVYTGAKDITSGVGHAATVVLHLMQEKLDKGHALYMDNFYNSHSLAATLLKHKTYCTGTIRANRKNNCTEVIKKTLQKGEVLERCDEMNGIIQAKWHDKRDVTFISTEYSADLLEVQNRRGEYKQKPEAIVQYNKYMSGVDRKDQMLAYNVCDRKTLRWYKKTGIYILQVLLLNSWFLFNKYSGNKMNFYNFRLVIIEHLLKRETVVLPKRVQASENVHLPSSLPRTGGKIQRKDCRVCKSKKHIRQMTNFCCTICAGNPGLCLEPCFQIWHNQ